MRRFAGWLAALFGLLTFAFSGGNRFTPLNVSLWLLALGLGLLALRSLPGPWPIPRFRSVTRREALIFALVLAIGVAFRFVALSENPRDMNSDQAEKLLDVFDVLGGRAYIFFERNTGREPWQFYWTLGLIKLFGLRPDFQALKLGTSLVSVLMLPGVYLLAREVFGRRAAAMAMLFAAVASWGVIPARFGLRYPFAPAATAWTMWLLLRGLKRGELRALGLAGLAMGIGLLGYTAFRGMLLAVPVVLAAVALWHWRRGDRAGARGVVIGGLAGLGLMLLVLAPLLRYGVEHPDLLLLRSATRVAGIERPLEGSLIATLLDNLARVALMFHVVPDNVWVVGLPGQPALDGVLGVLLVVGCVLTVVHSQRRRDPLPALTLLAGALMLLPSALALAFPAENPSLVRTGGALPMLMTVCAAPWAAAPGSRREPARLAPVAGALIAVAVIALNAQRVFVDYPAAYCPRAQNASDVAAEFERFIASGGRADNAFMVGYPHWIDYRAVGAWLGDPRGVAVYGTQVSLKDPATAPVTADRALWALNVNDQVSLAALAARYPAGALRQVPGSHCGGKDFLIFEFGAAR
ncbi:MAG: glycosyltransferase family 39 protein [Thermoflexales bacterium]|nr:glycosyltransferase family 39 protein [Thermoflexales bacterium]